MDKYEYKLKLDEIESLAAAKNYAAAAQIADGINWRKVRNVNSLMLVGEIYQQNGRYEDSKELLLLAYDRSPIGKKIIYRLAEIAIEANQLEEAQEYYDEFVEIAPHDTMKYILRYRMSRAKGEPFTEQIAILSDLKEQEYTEEWAFELAYLYHEAGMASKCMEACDELILWFGDGPYVEKALELKMLYEPLAPEQEAKYRMLREKHDGIVEVHPDEYLESGEIINNTMKIPQVQVNAGRYSTQNLQEELARGIQQIMEASQPETSEETMDTVKKMMEEFPYVQPMMEPQPADEQVGQYTPENYEPERYPQEAYEPESYEPERYPQEAYAPESYEPESYPQEAYEPESYEPERYPQEAYAPESYEPESYPQEAYEPESYEPESYPQEAYAPESYEPERYPQEAYEPESYPQEAYEPESYEPESYPQDTYIPESYEPEPQRGIDHILNDWEETKRNAAFSSVPEEMQHHLDDAHAAALQEASNLMEQLAAVMPQFGTDAMNRELVEQAYEGQTPEAMARASRALADANARLQAEIDRLQASMEQSVSQQHFAPQPEETGIRYAQEPTDETGYEQMYETQPEPIYEPEPEDAYAPQQMYEPSYESDMQMEYEPESAYEPDDAQKYESEYEPEYESAYRQQTPETLAAELAADGLEMYEEESELEPEPTPAPPQRSRVSRELRHPVMQSAEKGFPNMPNVFLANSLHSISNHMQPQTDSDSEEPLESEEHFDRMLSDWEAMKDPTTPLPEINTELLRDLKHSSPAPPPQAQTQEQQPEFEQERFLSINEIKKFDEQMAEQFSYFTKVDGMETQICRALTRCSAYLEGVGSDGSGNLVIEGASGCGKTMLATNFVKTLQQLTGKPGKQIGKINGDALNHKSIPDLMARISGGCLIVERAGELSRETQGKISQYMDQHVGECFVILEDTKEQMTKTLLRHETFARKFSQLIKIPYFTNDELVEFGRTYAAENGYEFDTLAVLALYRRISSIQKLDQATTLVEVKELIDEAIDHAQKGGLKKMFGFLGTKRYDEHSHLILREKDFED